MLPVTSLRLCQQALEQQQANVLQQKENQFRDDNRADKLETQAHEIDKIQAKAIGDIAKENAKEKNVTQV